MRFLKYGLLLAGLASCATAPEGELSSVASTDPVTTEAVIPLSGTLLIEDGGALRCFGAFTRTQQTELISSGLSCDDSRNGTVSFQDSTGLLPATGLFFLDDGTKGRVAFVKVDETVLLGRLEKPKRPGVIFAPDF